MADINITNIPSTRIDFIDKQTGLMSREWYRFFLNLFTLTGGGSNAISLDELQIGPPSGSSESAFGSVTSVDVSGGSTGLTTSGGPITSAGTITLAGVLNIANGGTGATTAAGAPFALKGANADITSLSGLTGPISSPTYVQFGSGSGTALVAGRMWYDNTTGSLNFGMGGGNITQQVGEEIFVYGKASAAITDSPLQIIYHTGTVGASGVVTFGPTVASITDANAIIGIATESLALNGFGRITAFGVVRGITTNGTAFGETWADDDVIWYNPVTGNPTKVAPVAPYIKVQVGTVIHAGAGGSGSFQVEINRGSTLGGTDSNVQFGTLANNNLIAYDSTAGYWKNVTSSALGFVTSVTGTSPVVSSAGTTPVISLAAGYGDTLNPYASKTANYFLAAPNGTAGVPTFRAVVAADIPTLNQNTSGSAATLTTGRTIAITGDLAYTSPSFDGSTNITAAGTLATVNSTTGSFTNASITVNGKGLVTAASSGTAPVTSVTGTSPVASSGGTTPAISLTAGYGDTLNPYASKTANYFLAAPNGASGVPTFRAVVAADIPTLNQNTSGTASNVTGTVAIANGGTGQTTAVTAFDALAPTTTKGDLIVRTSSSNIRVAVGADTYALVADSSTASGVKWAAAGASLTIANDTTTATNLYPTFLTATSGTATTLYTGNAKLLYKPSTGEFTAPAHISSNGITINSLTVSTSYSIASGYAGVSAGPITVSSGVTVTVASGSRWVVV
jgi:hypothetical protein